MSESARIRLLLLATSLVWGTSFMLIEVAIRDMTPLFVAAVRLAVGAMTLWLWLAAAGRIREARTVLGSANRTQLLSIAAVGFFTALPFTLMNTGQLRVDSSIAGMINASVPLYVSLLVLIFLRHDLPDAKRFAGLVTGFVGVLVIALSRGIDGGNTEVVGIVLVTCASMSYAIGAVITRANLSSVRPMMVATWSITVAAVLMSPWLVLNAPADMPSPESMASLAMLGVAGTGLGVALYYTLLARAGAPTASTVNYLLPIWATLWGVTLLGEPIYAGALAGLALILVGTWVASKRTPRSN